MDMDFNIKPKSLELYMFYGVLCSSVGRAGASYTEAVILAPAVPV